MSFIEILEEQIRKDLRKEIEAEVRAELAKEKGQEFAENTADPTENLAARLATGLKRFTFRTQTHVGYPRSKRPETVSTRPEPREPNAKPVPPEIRKRAETFQTLCAFELLRRHSGNRLPEEFTESELKSAWRQAALKSHPDRHLDADATTQAQMAALFRELQTAYALLAELFQIKADAAKAA